MERQSDFRLNDIFNKHVELLRLISQIPDLQMRNEHKLQLYALYKQATIGPCDTQKPSFFDPKGRYKHDAWSALGNTDSEDAKRQYIELINELIEGGQFGTDEEVTDDLDEILVELKALYEEYKGIQRRYPQGKSGARAGKYNYEEREESSLFQPGAEVCLLQNQQQHSLLETVQDLVQHDIVEPSVDGGKPYSSLQEEDPLNVMEPRPTNVKNLSEESLLRTAKSYGEIYEMLMDTNKRVEAIERQLLALSDQICCCKWLSAFLQSPLSIRSLKITSSVLFVLFLLRTLYRLKK